MDHSRARLPIVALPPHLWEESLWFEPVFLSVKQETKPQLDYIQATWPWSTHESAHFPSVLWGLAGSCFSGCGGFPRGGRGDIGGPLSLRALADCVLLMGTGGPMGCSKACTTHFFLSTAHFLRLVVSLNIWSLNRFLICIDQSPPWVRNYTQSSSSHGSVRPDLLLCPLGPHLSAMQCSLERFSETLRLRGSPGCMS